MEIPLVKSSRTLCDCRCSSYVFPTASRTVAHADRGCSPRIYHLGVMRRESTALDTQRANLRSNPPPMPAPERSGAVTSSGGLRALWRTDDCLLPFTPRTLASLLQMSGT